MQGVQISTESQRIVYLLTYDQRAALHAPTEAALAAE